MQPLRTPREWLPPGSRRTDCEGGDLAGPSQQFTLEMDRGLDSAMRLAERDVEGILCYHGGYVPVDAERIREVVGELR